MGYFHRRALNKQHTGGSDAAGDNGSTESLFNLHDTAMAVDQACTAKLLKHAEWNATSTLQLQRLAFEGIGSGTWSCTSSETPVTLPNQPLATLDFKKPPASHPYLVKRASDQSQVCLDPIPEFPAMTEVFFMDFGEEEGTESHEVEISETGSEAASVLDDSSSYYSRPTTSEEPDASPLLANY